MTTKEFKINGMSCGHCVKAVQATLGKLPGIVSSGVQIGSATIAFDETKLSETQIRSAIEDAGYAVAGVQVSHPSR